MRYKPVLRPDPQPPPPAAAAQSTIPTLTSDLLALTAGKDPDSAANQVLLTGPLNEGRGHKVDAGQLQLAVVLHDACKLDLRRRRRTKATVVWCSRLHDLVCTSLVKEMRSALS